MNSGSILWRKPGFAAEVVKNTLRKRVNSEVLHQGESEKGTTGRVNRVLNETDDLDELGWIGFDATNGGGDTDRYARVIVGPDDRVAAPLCGPFVNGDDKQFMVTVEGSQGRAMMDA